MKVLAFSVITPRMHSIKISVRASTGCLGEKDGTDH
jgi:hypothetical protein